ncbi:hypothetical protein [Bradyrhizobium sp. RT3b]|uniref:hypothetical protein n=1 Tax=Bradyrhizobium sp. RT3b TaxID=3156334 RepID=UPI00339A4916
MTAYFSANSQDAKKAALHGMQKRAATRGFVTPNLKKARPDDLELCWGHRLAFVQLNELPENGSIRAAARISGWRFFVVESGVPIAAAHVMRDVQGEFRLSELNEGQFVAGTLEALKDVFGEFGGDSKDETRLPPFELLLLVAPAVCFVGWWLQFEDQRYDWIVPVSPTFSSIKSKRLAPKELVRALKEEYEHAAQVMETS